MDGTKEELQSPYTPNCIPLAVRGIERLKSFYLEFIKTYELQRVIHFKIEIWVVVKSLDKLKKNM